MASAQLSTVASCVYTMHNASSKAAKPHSAASTPSPMGDAECLCDGSVGRSCPGGSRT